MPVPFCSFVVSTTLAPRNRTQATPFPRTGFDHGDDQRISFGGTNHGQPEAGIPAGCLNPGLPGFQSARSFRRLDDVQRQPVLDRSAGIEGFGLHIHCHVIWRQTVDPDRRRVADRFQNRIVKPSAPIGLPCHDFPPKKSPVRIGPAGNFYNAYQ